jgi:site-specific DNA-methyltransferase (adenine-specific)
MPISEVYNCDWRDYTRSLPDKYFDILIADPNYGINAPKMQMGAGAKCRNGKTSTAVRLKGRLNTSSGKLKDRILNRSEIDWDNKIPPPEDFTEMFRISKHQIIWGGNYFPLPPTRCIIVWDKCQPWENFSQVEIAWTSFDFPAKLYRISNTGGANKEKKIHETQKPIALYDNCYRDFVKKGWKVFDPYLGSGSNRISADKFGVDFIGCEIGKMHFTDQEERFEIYKQQLKINF